MRGRKNPGVAYSGRVGAKLRPRKGYVTVRRIVKRAFRLAGGPLDRATVRLDAHSDWQTLVFQCKGQVGRYVRGVWEQA